MEYTLHCMYSPKRDYNSVTVYKKRLSLVGHTKSLIAFVRELVNLFEDFDVSAKRFGISKNIGLPICIVLHPLVFCSLTSLVNYFYINSHRGLDRL